eukprot:1781582-Pleurochrysis_carterae.AAC.1
MGAAAKAYAAGLVSRAVRAACADGGVRRQEQFSNGQIVVARPGALPRTPCLRSWLPAASSQTAVGGRHLHGRCGRKD